MKRIPRYYDGSQPTGRPIQGLLDEMLTNFFHRFKERPYLILEAWPQVVGPRIAHMSRAVSFNDGILKVCVNNSTLLNVLSQYEKKGLMTEFRKRFPQIKLRDISFKMG